MTKQSDAVWAEGDAAGGFPSALTLTADTWYHFFAIGKTRNGTGGCDFGWDTSLSAANLLADATAYSYYRRLCSMLTDGSADWVPFTQQGDRFMWDDPVRDVNASNPGTSAVTAALSVPNGLQVLADISVSYTALDSGGPYGLILTSLDQTDTAPSTSFGDILLGSGSTATKDGVVSRLLRTDTSRQIRYRLASSGANHHVRILTHGWLDRRGQDD